MLTCRKEEEFEVPQSMPTVQIGFLVPKTLLYSF
jgi:hypothetical protein